MGDLVDAEARTAPLFYKSALPSPVRVTPSFLVSGLFALSEDECFVTSGPEIWKLSARRHAPDDDRVVRDALSSGAPTAPLASMSAERVSPASSPCGGDMMSVTAVKGPTVTVAAVDASGGIAISVARQYETTAARTWQTTHLEGPGFRDGESGWGGVAFSGDGGLLAVARQWQRSLGICM